MVITQIRNALIHSDNGNRKKIKNIPDAVLVESVNLSVLYIEMAILHTLKYEGNYNNRCSPVAWQGMEDVVPWASAKSILP